MAQVSSRDGSYPVSAEMMAAEDAGWDELQGLIGSLSREEVERPGYYPEGWSTKDVLAHVGSWLAESAAILDQIRMGTHRPEEIDVDAMNERFLELMRDVDLDTVRAQASAARARMLQAWGALPQVPPEAAAWIRKAGVEHYDEHLPRLRAWVAELRGTTVGEREDAS